MEAAKWTRVDELNTPPNLWADDPCYYYLTYTSRMGYEYSRANQLVLNYKIPMGGEKGIRNRPSRARHKENAIREYAQALSDFLTSWRLGDSGTALTSLGERVGLVPVPPSKVPSDPDYDDRNVRACEMVCARTGFRLCRDVETAVAIGAAHAGGSRDPRSIEESLGRVSHGANDCDFVFIVDDVLVTGAHFVAVRACLEKTGFAGQPFGLFLAKTEWTT